MAEAVWLKVFLKSYHNYLIQANKIGQGKCSFLISVSDVISSWVLQLPPGCLPPSPADSGVSDVEPSSSSQVTQGTHSSTKSPNQALASNKKHKKSSCIQIIYYFSSFAPHFNNNPVLVHKHEFFSLFIIITRRDISLNGLYSSYAVFAYFRPFLVVSSNLSNC